MAKPSIYWLQMAAQTLAKIVPGVATLLGFVAWLYNIVEIALVAGLDYVNNKLAEIDTSSFSNANFNSLQWIGYLNAVFPLSEYLAILSAYFTAWGIVVLVRWVKSFFPTVAN